MRKRSHRPIEPHEDYGFFGPDSVTWRVWGYPTSLTVGFQRSVVVEELDPALIAAVDETRAIRDRPRTRYDRTLSYFAMVAFGDSRSTSTASDVLVKIHSKAIGIEPGSGERYDANDPASQLWIHLTAWHSILYAYEKYGPGRLSPEDEARYWEECAIGAELQTCDPADVPRSREGIKAYFEYMRPRLVGSDAAKSTMDHLLHAEIMLPPLHPLAKPVGRLVARFLRVATIATMPQWMREMSGLEQSRFLDAVITPIMKTSFWLADRNARLKLLLISQLSPGTTPVVAPILLDVRPRNPVVVTPAQARERYGFAKPAQAHLEWRAKQYARVFDEHQRPSDAGLIESEPILGSLV
jgi:uncharacterized protein (DUF2236 family)